LLEAGGPFPPPSRCILSEGAPSPSFKLCQNENAIAPYLRPSRVFQPGERLFVIRCRLFFYAVFFLRREFHSPLPLFFFVFFFSFFTVLPSGQGQDRFWTLNFFLFFLFPFSCSTQSSLIAPTPFPSFPRALYTFSPISDVPFSAESSLLLSAFASLYEFVRIIFACQKRPVTFCSPVSPVFFGLTSMRHPTMVSVFLPISPPSQ